MGRGDEPVSFRRSFGMISPLVGEMAGRSEWGAKKRDADKHWRHRVAHGQ